MTSICPSKLYPCSDFWRKNENNMLRSQIFLPSSHSQYHFHPGRWQTLRKEFVCSHFRKLNTVSSYGIPSSRQRLEEHYPIKSDHSIESEGFELDCVNLYPKRVENLILKIRRRNSFKVRASTSSPPLITAHPDGNLPPFVASLSEGNLGLQLGGADDETEVLIECKNVYKSFGDKHILRGANFKIRVGEAVGIIGPSGTGKSTVLRIMAGLLAPDSGEVIVCGKPRTGLISDEANPNLRIGLVFQSAALFDSLTVRENVGFMLYEHSDLSEIEIREQVSDSLAAVGLKGVEERLPAELSGGMKKRVALARAIISDGKQRAREREVVMYDEPTAGLDPIASTVVEDLIRSLHIREGPEGTEIGKIASYVVVTHQHSTIRRAVDRILFLHEGKVVWEGTTAEFDATDNPIVRQFADGSLNGPIKY